MRWKGITCISPINLQLIKIYQSTIFINEFRMWFFLQELVYLRQFFFSFYIKCQSGDINVIVVLQISTYIHILNKKYHISTYQISIILFSYTIWRFHPNFFKIWSFLAIRQTCYWWYSKWTCAAQVHSEELVTGRVAMKLEYFWGFVLWMHATDVT